MPRFSRDAITERGVADGAFVLPATSAAGDYTLAVRSPEESFLTQRRHFFVGAPPKATARAGDVAERRDVQVAFYPEGGALVAGLENRVYFVARDSSGRPIALSGKIVADQPDEAGHEVEVTVVETALEGMGVFSIFPQAGITYRLKISSPKPSKNEPTLPEVSTEKNVVLSTGSGVFAAGKPLEFNIRAAEAGLTVGRGRVLPGRASGPATAGDPISATGANPVAIDLDDAVAGVIRLIVYDYSACAAGARGRAAGLSPPDAEAEGADRWTQGAVCAGRNGGDVAVGDR